ncbi:trigger factor [Isosphaeraceae bacterium EP7]
MSTGEHEHETAVSAEDPRIESEEQGSGATTATEEAPAKRKLDLDVQISDAGPCKKHLKVAIPRADVDKEFDESFGTMKRQAQVPGFRPGRAPRQLVEKRFRKEVSGQVKSNLLMACLEQLDTDYKLKPITSPQLDVEAIEIPETGPMLFELDIEVQPEFSLPAYKALSVKRPVRQVTEADIDGQVQAFLERYAQLVPKLEGGAEVGDYVTANLNFHLDGKTLNEVKEVQFRLYPELRFQDGVVPDAAGALAGVKADESRETTAIIGSSSPSPELRGKTIAVTFQVLDLKRLRLPEVDAAFFEMTGFDDLADLREALKGMLGRRYEFQARQDVRKQILDALVSETNFELPIDLVGRQERGTVRRMVAELRDSGLSESQIRAREAEIRANAHESTLRSLKEFFILSQIAEVEEVKVEEADFEQEIEAMAARTDESPRRIRARIEKENLADSLATQILERKTIDRILEFTKVEDVPLVLEERDVETLDEAAVAAPLESPETTPEPTEGQG